ncbi:hypothetical protein EDD86DRAFT_246647 [Gorgonomyces haynaldii]|nr:hypothetical protein EDD86DRAFT_246647 [Gorgonomyces haynaldii]
MPLDKPPTNRRRSSVNPQAQQDKKTAKGDSLTRPEIDDKRPSVASNEDRTSTRRRSSLGQGPPKAEEVSVKRESVMRPSIAIIDASGAIDSNGSINSASTGSAPVNSNGSLNLKRMRKPRASTLSQRTPRPEFLVPLTDLGNTDSTSTIHYDELQPDETATAEPARSRRGSFVGRRGSYNGSNLGALPDVTVQRVNGINCIMIPPPTIQNIPRSVSRLQTESMEQRRLRKEDEQEPKEQGTKINIVFVDDGEEPKLRRSTRTVSKQETKEPSKRLGPSVTDSDRSSILGRLAMKASFLAVEPKEERSSRRVSINHAEPVKEPFKLKIQPGLVEVEINENAMKKLESTNFSVSGNRQVESELDAKIYGSSKREMEDLSLYSMQGHPYAHPSLNKNSSLLFVDIPIIRLDGSSVSPRMSGTQNMLRRDSSFTRNQLAAQRSRTASPGNEDYPQFLEHMARNKHLTSMYSDKMQEKMSLLKRMKAKMKELKKQRKHWSINDLIPQERQDQSNLQQQSGANALPKHMAKDVDLQKGYEKETELLDEIEKKKQQIDTICEEIFALKDEIALYRMHTFGQFVRKIMMDIEQSVEILNARGINPPEMQRVAALESEIEAILTQ